MLELFHVEQGGQSALRVCGGTSAATGDVMRSSDFTKVLSAHRWLIVTTAILAASAAVAISILSPRVYESEALVYVSQRSAAASALGVSDSGGDVQAQRNLSTQLYLLQNPEIASEVVRKLRLPMTGEQLLRNVQISVLGQSNLLSISVRDTSRTRSAMIANALADTYVDWSRRSESQALKAAEDAVEKRRKQALASIAQLEARIRAGGASAEVRSDLDVAKAIYAPLPAMLERLRTSQQIVAGSGEVVGRAQVPLRPSNTAAPASGALGLGAGLVLGVGLALARRGRAVRCARPSSRRSYWALRCAAAETAPAQAQPVRNASVSRVGCAVIHAEAGGR